MSEVEVHVDKLSKREKQNSSNMPLKLHLPSEIFIRIKSILERYLVDGKMQTCAAFFKQRRKNSADL